MNASAALVDLPLFPLSTVLFPGGRLELRIFEQRYLDLVRDCARHDAGFGICLLLEGSEAQVGEAPVAALPATVGTLARIVDFYTLPDGLLGIRVQGDVRFEALTTRVRDNGLVRAQARLWPAEPSLPLPAEHGLLATILERLHDRIGGPLASADKACYDDATWVGFRLAEALPLAADERQLLLQLTDPIARLERLLHYLPRFQRG